MPQPSLAQNNYSAPAFFCRGAVFVCFPVTSRLTTITSNGGTPVEIFYDSYQEGVWFKDLHQALEDSGMHPFPKANDGPELLRTALLYDRPDIILVDNDKPILVLERTTEVPSGHNVGQRFARLVAAARMQVPAVYFGPYEAFKHGGATKGPRKMNLRLFHALDTMAKIEKSAVTTINWPVDKHYEIIQTPSIRDARPRAFMELFFSLYSEYGLPEINRKIMNSTFQREQEVGQNEFIANRIRNPAQYDSPPDSVRIGTLSSIPALASKHPTNLRSTEIVFYVVGMNYIRSDPYVGMAMLYSYLYCGGMEHPARGLVLNFPNITRDKWRAAASGRDRKDIRLFRLASDGILFTDGYLPKSSL
jgi:hypothetical protein